MAERLASEHADVGFCASFARAVMAYVLTHGGDGARVVQALGYASSHCLDKAGRRISAGALGRALHTVSALFGDEHAGLRIGMGMRLSQLGALGYAAMTAQDALGAMQLFEELQQLCATEFSFRHEVTGTCMHVRLERHLPLADDYLFWSFLLACRLNVVRGAGGQVAPLRIDLPCAPPRCDRMLNAFAGTSVRFHAQAYGEWFRLDDLREPNPQGSPEIHLVMTAMARRAWRESRDPNAWMIARLKGLIHQALERGLTPTLRSLAPQMAPGGEAGGPITARQLQRKLTGADQGFRALVGEVRRERALAQLRSTDRPLADIAAEAGYAELSSFHRAVRRWTGLTPMRIRKEGAGRQEESA